MSRKSGFIVGVDIGGTFTDIICIDPVSGEMRILKTPTTWPDPADGMVAGIIAAVGDLSTIATVIHGTTIATNAILERKGAAVGLITTRGFRDVLEMRRRQRRNTYGLTGDFIPLVPRQMRLEAIERVDAQGNLQLSLDESSFVNAVGELRAAGAQAIAICFINSFVNATNEYAAEAIVRKNWPEAYVSVSARVLPEIKEFERTSTTVVNAAVQPVLDTYLNNVQNKLAASGYAGVVSIVQSNGGISSIAATLDKPVTTILSGPAAGVTGANEIARQAGIRDIVTFDMGGTSLDVAVIVNNEPLVTSETQIDFGVVIKVPMIQISTIGAGGGSIALVDSGGFLAVGPESAGAEPGPVAYRRGGNRPTVTDANLVLGRINANRPIGRSGMKFDVEAAELAIAEQIGVPLGLTSLAAAEAIITIANTKMAGAVRLATIEKGYDPRKFTLLAYGGAGPLHAAAVCREVGIPRLLIPYFPGLTSAVGCAVGHVQYDFVKTLNRVVDSGSVEAALAIWNEQRIGGERMLESGDRFSSKTRIVYSADMQYEGQTHPLLVTFDAMPDSQNQFRDAFTAAYRKAFGLNLSLPVKVVSVRLSLISYRPAIDLISFSSRAASSHIEQAHLEDRRMWIDGGWQLVKCFERSRLPVGATFTGPAVVEQEDTTILIESDMVVTVDAQYNLIVDVNAKHGKGY